MRHFNLALIAFALAACGDNAVNNMQDAAADQSAINDLTTPVDHSIPPDLAPNPDFSGLSCGAMTCTGSDVCCVQQTGQTAQYACAPSCADGGIAIGCQGPDNCMSGSSNICCATVQTEAANNPPINCGIAGGDANCASACNISEPLQCGMPWTVVLCHRKSDCANFAGYTDCCLYTYNGNEISLCASPTAKFAATSCAQ